MVTMQQKEVNLYSTAFRVFDDKGDVVGNIDFSNDFNSEEGTFSVFLNGCGYAMAPVVSSYAKEVAGDIAETSIVRPYAIAGDIGVGVVFHDKIRTGFMKKMEYNAMRINEADYQCFFVDMKDKGVCAPVLRNGEHIGSIKKDATGKNGFHEFKICPETEWHVPVFLLFCCYIYVITYHVVDEKLRLGWQKSMAKANM